MKPDHNPKAHTLSDSCSKLHPHKYITFMTVGKATGRSSPIFVGERTNQWVVHSKPGPLQKWTRHWLVLRVRRASVLFSHTVGALVDLNDSKWDSFVRVKPSQIKVWLNIYHMSKQHQKQKQMQNSCKPGGPDLHQQTAVNCKEFAMLVYIIEYNKVSVYMMHIILQKYVLL